MHSKNIVSFIFFVLGYSSIGIGNEYPALLSQYLSDHCDLDIEIQEYSGNTSQPIFLQNILASNPSIQTIGEVGFHAGHSSVLFLEANPNAIIYSFDLMNHEHAYHGKDFIDQEFPDRHYFIEGASIESVPLFYQENPSLKFDFVFINGGSDYETALKDIENMKSFAHKNTILIIDNLSADSVKNAFEKCVKEGIITRGSLQKSKHKVWSICRYVLLD